jgi:hypothetical protein
MAFKGTYSAGSGYDSTVEMRESLLDIIRDISPNEDNYFISNLAKGSPATQTVHEWNIYHEARASSVSPSAEGAETVFPDLQAEVRSQNYTTILESPMKLSRTKASIAEVTGADAMGVEKERALKRLKSKMEYAIVNGAVAAGSTSTARQLAGIVNCISTNVTLYASTADLQQSFTETILNDMVQISWDSVGADYVADVLAVPAVIKRRIAGFGTNLTRNVPASDKRLTKEVRVYDTEVGPTITVIANKDVPHAAHTETALLVREDMFELAFLVNSGEPHWEERPQTGDWKGGTYMTEFTLVSFDEKASVKFTGFAPSL